MRIAVLAPNESHVGGAETYVTRLIHGLSNRAHDVLVWFEGPSQTDRPPIVVPPAVRIVRASGRPEDALRELEEWRPRALLCQGIAGSPLEPRVTEIAPAILFAHSYVGACISGSRAHAFPRWSPCERRFGCACLVHYLPRRCGGRNPGTMMRLYLERRRENRLLERYRFLVVHSTHVLREYLRQDVPESRLRLLHYPVWADGAQPPPPPARPDRTGDAVRLLFLGRMEENKGGAYLIDALPLVAAAYRGKVQVLFAGDGSARRDWETRARRSSGHASVEVRFAGWLEGLRARKAIEDADAIVVPSVWPEPFGLVGPEAGLLGVPAIAFDVGGISDWLSDGVNGYLAPGRPPTPRGLADAILRFLRAPRKDVLRANAWEYAHRFSPEAHFRSLDAILREVEFT